MTDLVSAWTEEDPKGDRVVLVMRDGDGVRFRGVPARWSFFARGLSDKDRMTLARDPRVAGVSEDEHGYTRIDCKRRSHRRQLTGLLFAAMEHAQAKGREVELEVLEADVPPLRRLLSDNPTLDISETPRLIWIDIEVDSRKSIADQKEGKARLLSWGFADADGNSGVEVLATDSDDAERELFAKLFTTLDSYDCVLAWYGDGYDFEVLQTRAAELRARHRGQGIPWHRWTWLDHLEVFKKYLQGSDLGGEAKTSFALDHVAGYLLGEGKLEFDAAKTWEAWRDTPDKLAAYNLRDCELLPRIEEKTGFIALHLAVCHVCRVFPDTASLNATQQGDGFLLRLGDEHGYRWASKRRFDEAPEAFAGAYVMEPTKLGVIDSVHVCDFSGLYPSIIRTWNMSPDTKVAGGLAGVWGDGVEPSHDDLRAEGIVRMPGRDTYFRTDHDGMFRIALDTLVAKRAEYQAAMKKETAGTPGYDRANRLQAAFKIVANSFYGILGSPWSRFFDRDIAEGVTQAGRWLLHQVIDEAKKKNLDPFYGDTDSVFITGAEDSMIELVSEMNESWPERLHQWGIAAGTPMHIDLDFEKTFSRIILISAKRYAGRFIKKKGKSFSIDAKPEVKGLEFKRGDTIRLAREMQVEIVFKLLGIGKPFDAPLPPAGEFRAIFDRWKKLVLTEELEPDAVILSQSISKPIKDYVVRYTTKACKCGYTYQLGMDLRGPETCPQCAAVRNKNAAPMHIRVVKQMAADGHEILVGNRIRYLVIRPERDAENRKAYPVPVYLEGAFARIDREYYWKRVGSASERVLEKVFPTGQWGDSTPEKRARELGRRREEFKGVISDLPLFGHYDIPDMADSTDGPRTTNGARRMRTRRRKKADPRDLNDDDRAALTKAIREKGAVDVAAYATEHGLKADAVAVFAKAIPRGKRRRKIKSGGDTPPAPAEDPHRRRRRKIKSGGDTPPAPAEKPPHSRRRRKKVEGVVFRLLEQSSTEDGAAESHRRKVHLTKISDFLEAHPGDVPFSLHIVFPKGILERGSLRTKVVIPIGSIAPTPEARAELEKLESRTSRVFGWPA